MQVAIPHQLGKDEVRQRLQTNSHKIGEGVPGGMAEVATSWPTQDRMAMTINAMGQTLHAHVDIEDQQVLFFVDLPPALGFIKPLVEGAIRQQAPKLLGPPS
jgi:hypothetical protein